MVADTDHSVLVASGGGNVYTVDTNTGQQTLFAYYGGLGAYSPWGMCRLPDGSLIATDQGNGKVVRIYPDGTSAVVSSGGLLHSTMGVVGLGDGTVAVGNVTDRIGNGEIVRINLQDGSQSYMTPPGSFNEVHGMSLEPDGNILVADSGGTGSGSVYRVRPSDGNYNAVIAQSAVCKSVFRSGGPTPRTLRGCSDRGGIGLSIPMPARAEPPVGGVAGGRLSRCLPKSIFLPPRHSRFMLRRRAAGLDHDCGLGRSRIRFAETPSHFDGDGFVSEFPVGGRVTQTRVLPLNQRLPTSRPLCPSRYWRNVTVAGIQSLHFSVDARTARVCNIIASP